MKDYFVYLPKNPANSICGCVATAAGYTNVLPNKPYPPNQHPLDHCFDWRSGRVLQSFQIILISAGSGVFECAAMHGVHAVKPGTVMVLFPGIWHRYRPVTETGWVEHWLECQGPVFKHAAQAGLIQPKHSLLNVESIDEFNDYFERCHCFARIDALANQDLLSTLGLHLVAMLGHLSRGERGFTKAIDDIVQRAHMLISLRCHEPLDMHGLADELGVGYSNLRHSFQARIGMSLRQYYLNTRIQKVKDLLVNSTKSIKQIADILGFESAAQLSKQFKVQIGESPGGWREKRGKYFRKRSLFPHQAMGLSGREKEILVMLSKGYSNKEIADELKLSIATILSYLKNVYGKMDVHSRTQAVAKYLSIQSS
jgi:DNA-binding CsgD family transcriptional regulator